MRNLFRQIVDTKQSLNAIHFHYLIKTNWMPGWPLPPSNEFIHKMVQVFDWCNSTSWICFWSFYPFTCMNRQTGNVLLHIISELISTAYVYPWTVAYVYHTKRVVKTISNVIEFKTLLPIFPFNNAMIHFREIYISSTSMLHIQFEHCNGKPISRKPIVSNKNSFFSVMLSAHHPIFVNPEQP